jgi:hypothetical protein
MGRKPSKGGSFTLHSFGGGLAGLRPKACGASSIADGAMVVRLRMLSSWKLGVYIMSRLGDMACLLSAIVAEVAQHCDCWR